MDSSGATDHGRLPSRVVAIEGLRGYLALWVVACHVMWYSGYEDSALRALPQLIFRGFYAVDIFVIVSGFVIFYLLDRRELAASEFIKQRFFRLFPLFFTLFVVSMLLYEVNLWNLDHFPYYTEHRISFMTSQMASWVDHVFMNVFLHATMLHGVVPESVVRDAPGAFLMPAWSISLEWQFYLLAPLLYAVATSRQGSRLLLVAFCIALYLGSIYILPRVGYGAFLPFHIEFFFFGAASYFLYRLVSMSRWRFEAPARADVCFPIAAMLAAVVAFSARSWSQIPMIFWILFLGIVLEPQGSLVSRIARPIFENRFTQYLGRISYSIYLSHALVLMLVQYCLLVAMPHLGQLAHCLILFVVCTSVTIALSGLLYRYIEVPGIAYGKRGSAKSVRDLSHGYSALVARLGKRPVSYSTRKFRSLPD